MLRVGVIGAAGYTGEQLIKLLVTHPEVRVTYISSKVEKRENFDEIFPSFKGIFNLPCDNVDVAKAINLCDVVFLALPHTVSMQFAPALLEAKKKVIDLSADYRFKDIKLYKQWYKTSHSDKKNLVKAVYGLPELYREDIKKATLIANPGCYPTAAILALAPILVSDLAKTDSIIIDAKSGLTGAGRKADLRFFFSEINENLTAYKINSHQHMPEINQELSKVSNKAVEVSFIPHLIPMNRGILETIYVPLKKNVSAEQVHTVYKRFYKTEPFVRVSALGTLPKISDVVLTNYCDIGITVDKKKKLLIIVSVIDNLMKGAAGQAVQNMNIICGFKESQSLK